MAIGCALEENISLQGLESLDPYTLNGVWRAIAYGYRCITGQLLIGRRDWLCCREKSRCNKLE